MALKKMEIRITSDTLKLADVEGFVRDMFLKNGINMEKFNKVLLCVNEAVINSISHGNKYNNDKSVVVQSYSCNKYLYFRIIDEGDGFNYNELHDPTDLENIFKESGRGIFIIKSFSDGIHFREKGNIIEFKIDLSGKD